MHTSRWRDWKRRQKDGIHKIIKYDSSIMTDSGGYQVLEYGEVDVKPLHGKIWNGYNDRLWYSLDNLLDLDYQRNKQSTLITLKVCKTTIKNKKNNGQIWIGPIQGSEHPELVKRSTNELIIWVIKCLFGKPIEFMESMNTNY